MSPCVATYNCKQWNFVFPKKQKSNPNSVYDLIHDFVIDFESYNTNNDMFCCCCRRLKTLATYMGSKLVQYHKMFFFLSFLPSSAINKFDKTFKMVPTDLPTRAIQERRGTPRGTHFVRRGGQASFVLPRGEGGSKNVGWWACPGRHYPPPGRGVGHGPISGSGHRPTKGP